MITAAQSKLLTFIDGYTREHGGVAPTFEEMQGALDLGSKSQVHGLLCGLEERGMIRRLKGRARSIEVLRLPGEPLRPVNRPAPAIPAPARVPLRLTDIACHIAAQDWCAADAETVLAAIRELRP